MIKTAVKTFFAIILGIFLSCGASANDTTVLRAGVSLNSQIPIELMGTWRVVSNLETTNAVGTFKPLGVDIWNLFKSADVITLSNPLSGAKASVDVEFVKNNTVKFSKAGNYDNQKLTDTVEITISGNTFVGKNYLLLTSTDGGEKKATYTLKGSKISGGNLTEN